MCATLPYPSPYSCTLSEAVQTISAGAIIKVNQFTCGNSLASGAPCIFQPGSALNTSTVFVLGRAVLDLQADNIMPATKGATLGVRGSVAKMRTHAFAELYCYLCTLVGGTLTVDQVGIASGGYFNARAR